MRDRGGSLLLCSGYVRLAAGLVGVIHDFFRAACGVCRRHLRVPTPDWPPSWRPPFGLFTPVAPRCRGSPNSDAPSRARKVKVIWPRPLVAHSGSVRALRYARQPAEPAPPPLNPDSLAAFAFILLMLAIGKMVAWRGWLPDSASDALNWVVLNLCLPAAVLLHVPRLTLDAKVPAVAAVPWILFGVSIALVLAVSRLLRWPREVCAVLLILVPLGNTSFLGYPLIAALLGSDALPYAVIYDQFGSFLMMTTAGLFIIAWYSGGERPTVGEIGKRILLFPPFIALLLALFMPAEYPVMVSFGLERLADALLPMVVLALGMKLQFRLPRELIAPLTIGLTAKLLLLPALALLFAPRLGLSDLALQVSVLESAMPPMITAAALVAAARLAPELATAMVGYGIVIALGTLAMWMWLIS